ncbi:MAG: chemotaxis-specific protein-glutamate methyltransferase CheB [Candidatus Sulfotelmatobacter sp.]
MIRVLVVEDSPTVREFLLQILRSDPAIEVVGTAETGEEALEAVARTQPDIITMDVHMPKMNGFDATRRIMETHPTPIVIVSGTTDFTDTSKAFRAIESGALAVLQKPSGAGHLDHEQGVSELIRTVKVMSEVKVVRRWPRSRPAEVAPEPALCKEIRLPAAQSQPKIIAIGASTGGPPVLQTILAGLPQSFPVPILIVQHIAAGFTQGFVEWLAQSSSLPVHIPAHGQSVLPGQAYVAPDGLHMGVGTDGRVQLRSDEPENGLRPSVACLFRSVAKAYGQSAVGVLLTGMGKDGAWELKLMKEQGAVTIAQDQDTSVVHGMPGEAIRLGGATYVLRPEKIYLALTSLAGKTVSHNDRAMTNKQDSASEIEGLFLRRDLYGR